MDDRLREIEKTFGSGKLEIDDINWLLGEANKVKELEKANRDLKYSQRRQLINVLQKENLEFAKEIERLKVVEQAYEALLKAK